MDPQICKANGGNWNMTYKGDQSILRSDEIIPALLAHEIKDLFPYLCPYTYSFSGIWIHSWHNYHITECGTPIIQTACFYYANITHTHEWKLAHFPDLNFIILHIASWSPFNTDTNLLYQKHECLENLFIAKANSLLNYAFLITLRQSAVKTLFVLVICYIITIWTMFKINVADPTFYHFPILCVRTIFGIF